MFPAVNRPQWNFDLGESLPFFLGNLSSHHGHPWQSHFARKKMKDGGCNIALGKEIYFIYEEINIFLTFHYVLNFKISIGKFYAIFSFLSLHY